MAASWTCPNPRNLPQPNTQRSTTGRGKLQPTASPKLNRATSMPSSGQVGQKHTSEPADDEHPSLRNSTLELTICHPRYVATSAKRGEGGEQRARHTDLAHPVGPKNRERPNIREARPISKLGSQGHSWPHMAVIAELQGVFPSPAPPASVPSGERLPRWHGKEQLGANSAR